MHIRISHVLVILAVLTVRPHVAYAWGFEGHRIIALIAAHELTIAAKSNVEALLGEPDAASAMERYSIWADKTRYSRRETAEWHFVDIEIDSNGYKAARDCPHDDCVVGQITRDIGILKDRSLAKPVRAEALRFLIHFVGDEHQPLHCSDNHDLGGNDVRVILDGDHTSLHHVWDSTVIETIGYDPETVAAQLSAKITPAEKAAWSKGTPVSWADECWNISKRYVYAELRGNGIRAAPIILPQDYAQKKAAIAAEQLERAGIRLATILNAIFK